MLNDELEKIWTSRDPPPSLNLYLDFNRNRLLRPQLLSDVLNDAVLAHSDYVCSRTKNDKPKWRVDRCKKTYKVIKKNLIAALSSPNTYIRAWGKNVAEEQACAGKR